MSRIRVYGSKVIFDEAKDSQYFISRSETWDAFIKNVPNRGPCKYSVGHESANSDGKRINGKHLKEYTFDQACRRVERELAPKAG